MLRSIVCLLAICACTEPPSVQGPNLLVIVWDDVGTDKVGFYGENPLAPATPTLAALADEGVWFDRAYANPYCSPTRAGLVTGRYAFHYDIGTFLTTGSGWGMPSSEVTIAETLWRTGRYDSAALGKWHLAGPDDSWGHRADAEIQGFGYYQGAPDNLMGGVLPDGIAEDYFHYEKIEDGDWVVLDDYATTDLTDDALDAFERLEGPWLLWVAYHAAHRHWHAPPESLNPDGVTDEATETEMYDALVVSLDLELERLLAGMDEDLRANTDIVVISDNGTPGEVKTGPQRGLPGKGTIMEGGTRVPMVVAGPSVTARGRSSALVSHVDLYATLLDLAGVDATPPEESESFAPALSDPEWLGRESVYAEVFLPRGPGPHDERYDRTLRGQRYKLLRSLSIPERFYDLETDPFERTNLMEGPLTDEQASARAALVDALDDLDALSEAPPALP